MVLLRELFQKNLKQQKKNYYKLNTTGKYIINHKKMYYLTCNTEDEAKKGVELLKEVNWDRSEIPRIKEELGIVRQINTNKVYHKYCGIILYFYIEARQYACYHKGSIKPGADAARSLGERSRGFRQLHRWREAKRQDV